MTCLRGTANRNFAFGAGLLLSAVCAVGGCSSDNSSTSVANDQAGDASTSDALPDVKMDSPDATPDASKDGATCAAMTCSSVGAQCGEIVDGCGGKVNCGATCPQSQVCGAVAPNKCGSGTCSAKSCAQLGASCGPVSDQCSKILDCGVCGAPDTCGGGGTPNQCGSSSTGACGNGAVSSSCACGNSVVNSGFCCGGVARSKDCIRVRLDGGLVSGTSTFFGKVFSPLLPSLTAGTAYDSNEGITGNYPIANTDYDALYQNETWVDTSMPAVFTFPVDNGNYSVHLHFVDWELSKPGDRQFQVDLQGTRVLTDLDIISEVGKSTALVKSFDVAVTNGAIKLTLTNHVANAELAAIEILPRGEAHLPTTTTANHDPSVNAGTDQTLQSPASSVILTGTATDPDGDTLSYAWAKTAGGAATIVSPTAISTQVTGLAAGTYSFTLTVKDGKGGTASDTVNVTVSGGKIVDPAFYVSPSGSDSNAGTSAAKPFLTLEKARSAARASTTKTIYLLAGTYDRTATLELSSQDAGESWLGFPGQTPVLEGNGSAQTAMSINGDDITIRRLVIQNFTNIGIQAASTSNVTIDSNSIKNITGTNWGMSSIEIVNKFANGRITHNFIQGSGYCGIEANAMPGDDISNMVIDGNSILDTMRTVSDGGGIYVMDRGHSGVPVTISNNVIGGYGNGSTSSRGIYLDDGMSGVTIRNNIVYGRGNWGVQFHGGDHNVFQNNIFDISEADYVGMYQDAPSVGDFGMTGNVFTCNIVYSSASPAVTLWDYYKSGSAAIALPSVHGNVYWGTKGKLSNIGDIVDSSPIQVDPHFVDAANANYSFQFGPPTACFQAIDTSQVGPLPN